MNDSSHDHRTIGPEMRARIAFATSAAILVAGVLLVAVVLPAEYGVDPLGTGKALGLTRIAQTSAATTNAATEPAQELEPVRPGAHAPQSAPLKEDRVTLTLGPYEGREYKYRMEKGAGMVYAWTSTGKVRYDFHGEPQGAPKDYAESYQMSEGQNASGAFYAPTSGIHGWFWENLTSDDVTVTLTSTGFYASAVEFTADGQKTHELRTR